MQVWPIEMKMQTFRYIAVKKNAPTATLLTEPNVTIIFRARIIYEFGSVWAKTGERVHSNPFCDDL
jgi:hypothetical protein